MGRDKCYFPRDDCLVAARLRMRTRHSDSTQLHHSMPPGLALVWWTKLCCLAVSNVCSVPTIFVKRTRTTSRAVIYNRIIKFSHCGGKPTAFIRMQVGISIFDDRPTRPTEEVQSRLLVLAALYQRIIDLPPSWGIRASAAQLGI